MGIGKRHSNDADVGSGSGVKDAPNRFATLPTDCRSPFAVRPGLRSENPRSSIDKLCRAAPTSREDLISQWFAPPRTVFPFA